MNSNPSCNFSLHQFLENKPARSHYLQGSATPNYDGTFCISWANGDKLLLPYHFVHSVKLEIDVDTNTVIFECANYDIILKGYNLNVLIQHFWAKQLYEIRILNKRYITAIHPNKFYAFEMTKVERGR